MNANNGEGEEREANQVFPTDRIHKICGSNEGEESWHVTALERIQMQVRYFSINSSVAVVKQVLQSLGLALAPWLVGVVINNACPATKLPNAGKISPFKICSLNEILVGYINPRHQHTNVHRLL